MNFCSLVWVSLSLDGMGHLVLSIAFHGTVVRCRYRRVCHCTLFWLYLLSDRFVYRSLVRC